jgi:hypothetical protein
MQETQTEQAEPTTSPLAQIEYGTGRGVALRTMDDLWRFANIVLASGWAPKGYDSAQSIVVAIQYGAEVGLTPMTSLQRIAVINGRPSVYGDVMLGLCRRVPIWDETGFKEYGAGEGTIAVCECRRRGGNTCTRQFSIEDAKRAKLWGKAGPWTDYPQRMLQMRARGFALRDTFPDVLQGLYATEELADAPDYDAIVDAAPAPADPEPPPPPLDATLSKKAKAPKPVAAAVKDVVKDATVEVPGKSGEDMKAFDARRRKVLAMFEGLAHDKRAAVVDNVEGLTPLNAKETLKKTIDGTLLTAVEDSIRNG